MFKRSSKITALLVAAASMVSMVPAMAADTMRLGNKDGHVYSGVSFKDGKYGYYGYRTDDDNTGIYYNNGSKDKDTLIQDAADYSFESTTTGQSIEYSDKDVEGVKYGSNYVIATEGGNSDEYLIDLTTGKIADADTPEDQQASAKAKLISGMKKAERYNTTSDSNYEINDSSVEVQRLFKGNFGDIWYQYATTSAADTVSMDEKNGFQIDQTKLSLQDYAATSFGQQTTGASIYTGFVDANGKYIDASYTANLKVYNERKERATNIDEFGKLYKDEGLQVNLKGLTALAQDNDYIYALAKVDVVYYTPLNGTTVIPEGDNTTAITGYDFTTQQQTRTQYFVQKISKARGDQQDGAYLPKSVEAWQIDSTKGITPSSSTKPLVATYEDDGDRDDAAQALLVDRQHVSAINGVLYVTTIETNNNEYNGKVKVWKLKLHNDKIKIDDTTTLRSEFINNTQSKVDTQVVADDANADTDVEKVGDSSWEGNFTIDANGNTWVIYEGQVMMFDVDGFKTKYKTDRSFDSIDVYDSGNLIAWDSTNDGAYTTVQEGKDQTVADGQVVDPNLVDKSTVKTGWVQTGTNWTFFDATGAQVMGNWIVDKGTWYYLGADGNMVTGWQQVGGVWYLLNGSGAMQTGWQQVGGTWYYLQSSGAMKTGWLNDSGTWYYLASSGAMLADTTVDGYTLGASGAWIQ